MRREGPRTEVRLTGQPVSRGCTVARACMFNDRRHNALPQYAVSKRNVHQEVERVRHALGAVAPILEAIGAKVESEVGKAEAQIFMAQRMIVEEEGLHADIVNLIRENLINAETAVANTLDAYEARIAAISDVRLRERATDVGEIKRRLLDVLFQTGPGLECENESHCQRGRNRIVVAEELAPSMTVDLDTRHLMGFVTERGGAYSHGAILAQALGIPAVSGLPGIRERVVCGTQILVDGTTGEVVLWPRERTVATLHARSDRHLRLPAAVDPVRDFVVMGNIGVVDEVSLASRMKAEGIGLYRTEIEVIAQNRIPTEEELCADYSAVVKGMDGLPVTVRLFDVGSDKPLPTMAVTKEDNPALGQRGARFLLARPDLLRLQARAIARASQCGPIRVLYPMITTVNQFRELRELFLKSTADIARGEMTHGVMIEVPAACFEPDALLEASDFASVGTNDLLQYFLAVDRNNELVAGDYEPDQPVFWSFLEALVKAAGRIRKPLSLCGELAGNPKYVPRLIDIGINCVSVSSRMISDVRHAAREYLESGKAESLRSQGGKET